MKNWTKQLSRKPVVGKINTNLATALAHCPTLEAAGWEFRCGECHVDGGAYETGYGWGWHSHNEYQIEIVVSGRFEFETARRGQVALKPGDALVIPCKLAHRWRCLRAGAMIGVALELLPTVASIREDGRLIEDIAVISHAVTGERMDELLAQALERDGRPTYAKTLACRLFIMLADLMGGILPQEAEGAPGQAAEVRGQEIVGWVMNHLEKSGGARVRLDQIAAKVGVSGRHLHRLFQRHAGKSLHDYWLEHRLDRARRLLGEEGRKRQVKDIAFACGFSSLAYFSNSFRRAYGVAPSAMLASEIPMRHRYTSTTHAQPEEAAKAGRKRLRVR